MFLEIGISYSIKTSYWPSKMELFVEYRIIFNILPFCYAVILYLL